MTTKARTFISDNRLFEAIQELRTNALPKRDKMTLANMESRLNALNEKIRLGVLTEDQTNIELNKIRVGLLEICETLENPPSAEGPAGFLQQHWMKALVALCLLVPAAYFLLPIAPAVVEEEACTERKVAILVADFQRNEDIGFSNTLVVNLDNALGSEHYDVSPVGTQERTARYDKFIQEKYFANTCDTSGMFVNGLLSPKENVFNAYITIAGLEMQVPGLAKEKSINLANPKGLEFNVPENAEFLAQLILGIIKSYEGKAYEALDQFFELEKEASKGELKDDEGFTATIAHFKGNCYAMRGDEKRANEQYQKVRKTGNPELVRVANHNSDLAKEVYEHMVDDPELSKELSKNLREHAHFEKELAKILDSVGKGFSEGVKDIFGRIK